MNRFRRDQGGSSLVEFAVVFPLTVLVILGCVDASLAIFDWSSATKATYAGARTAAVNDPVSSATRFTLASYTTQATYSGRYCFDSATGAADGTSSCPTVSVTCTGNTAAAGGTCTSGTFSKAAFDKIFAAVQSAYPMRTLDRRQVQVSYVTTNLGYVGRQNFAGDMGELPLNVSVSLRCMTHEFFFVGPLLGWAFSSLPNSCAGITTGTAPGITMPPFFTTLPSEDLTTN